MQWFWTAVDWRWIATKSDSWLVPIWFVKEWPDTVVWSKSPWRHSPASIPSSYYYCCYSALTYWVFLRDACSPYLTAGSPHSTERSVSIIV